MGFRPDLDLSGILPQYQKVLDWSDPPGTDDFSVLTDPPIPPEPPNEPVLRGYGPEWCSSQTALALSPEICWDVNGYYRELGVHWRATRAELGRAYQEKCGNNDVRLTFVLQQLLHPESRAAYDRTPLGEVFLDDWMQFELKRKAHDRAYEMWMQGRQCTRDDVLEQWGYVPVPETAWNGPEPVDTTQRFMQDEDRSQETWEFSYYLWRTIVRHLPTLKQWQELLLQELSGRGCIVRFSVGMVGKEQTPAVLWVDGKDFIFFLNERHEPSPQLAAKVVERATTYLHSSELSRSLKNPN